MIGYVDKCPSREWWHWRLSGKSGRVDTVQDIVLTYLAFGW